MSYLTHPGCFWKENPTGAGLIAPERIGFLDIEASNLNASFGYIICYCIKKEGGEIVSRCLEPADFTRCLKTGEAFDKRLMETFLEDCNDFDRFITYYGKNWRFDVPYIRTRCLVSGVEFPAYGEMYVTDVFDYVKPKLKLHRNRLETVCDVLDIPSKGHKLNPKVWTMAMAGDKKSLDYILEHCKEDVTSTELVWEKMSRFGKMTKTSI
jgi:uncharacterized protein YprB with RNaseH-like and TPR domain